MPRVLVKKSVSTKIGLRVLAVVVVVAGIILSFPVLLTLSIQREQRQTLSAMTEQFPVTVDPRNKIIAENELVNTYLESPSSPLQAAVGNVGNVLGAIFTWLAVTISDASWYQSVAAVTVGGNRLVAIAPGMRKEQVALTFANALAWSAKQKKEFLNASSTNITLPVFEGSFAPGVYSVVPGATPTAVRALISDRFTTDVLKHYGTTTAQVVPLSQALTVASLIEREAGGADDMRLISGIIWNRLFINMRLQIDATLQYAKANTATAQSWWPGVVPADRFRASPYNTYLHPGLPPTPIANPSVAAILAALNPKNTSCLFYFHDAQKQFHCSDTYAGHVTLLKKYYGRGK